LVAKEEQISVVAVNSYNTADFDGKGNQHTQASFRESVDNMEHTFVLHCEPLPRCCSFDNCFAEERAHLFDPARGDNEK
jgi:hypothetical protein